MAQVNDLMAFGAPPFLANALATQVYSIVCQGTSLASANVMGNAGIYYVIASNSGSGVALPAIGGDGANFGDIYLVANFLGVSITVYSNATSIIGTNTSVSGATGYSATNGRITFFTPITASTWAAFKGS